jgi:hypothetical protein
MKTRRNHRKTTTGRRKRHVKQQRVKTRINHRKGTVSSGRRHNFFKRGGQNPFDRGDTTSKFGTYDNGRYIQSHQQNIAHQKQDLRPLAFWEPIEQNYPDVDAFVEKIVPNNTKVIIGDFGKIELTVKKLDKKDFYIDDVKKDQTPVTKQINNVTVKFYINHDGNTVVIYVDDMLYGYVMIKLNGTDYESDNRGIYNPDVSIAIKLDLIAASAT